MAACVLATLVALGWTDTMPRDHVESPPDHGFTRTSQQTAVVRESAASTELRTPAENGQWVGLGVPGIGGGRPGDRECLSRGSEVAVPGIGSGCPGIGSGCPGDRKWLSRGSGVAVPGIGGRRSGDRGWAFRGTHYFRLRGRL